MTISKEIVGRTSEIKFTLVTEADRRQNKVLYKGKEWSGKSLFLGLRSDLALQEDLELVCKVVSHLFLESCYSLIEDVESYKANYKAAVDRERALDSRGPKLSDYGIRQVPLIHPPTIKDNILEFYVTQIGSRVPFQVEVNIADETININEVPSIRRVIA